MSSFEAVHPRSTKGRPDAGRFTTKARSEVPTQLGAGDDAVARLRAVQTAEWGAVLGHVHHARRGAAKGLPAAYRMFPSTYHIGSAQVFAAAAQSVRGDPFLAEVTREPEAFIGHSVSLVGHILDTWDETTTSRQDWLDRLDDPDAIQTPPDEAMRHQTVRTLVELAALERDQSVADTRPGDDGPSTDDGWLHEGRFHAAVMAVAWLTYPGEKAAGRPAILQNQLGLMLGRGASTDEIITMLDEAARPVR